jgi:hypothetical protein
MTKHDIEFWAYVITLKVIMVGLVFLYAYYVTM